MTAAVKPKSKKLDRVIREVRACFHRLKVAGDAMHKDLGVTASMRGVMETIAEEGPQTVPQIARAKSVSRQHIQVTVDALARDGFVVLRDNPDHKRSPLVALADKGRRTFDEVRRREAVALGLLAEDVSAEALDATAATLAALRDALDRGAVEQRDD